MSETGSIVVGVDGTAASLDALRWAQGVAGPDRTVLAVTIWVQPPAHVDGALEGYSFPSPEMLGVLEDNARRIATDAIAMTQMEGFDLRAEVRMGVSAASGLLEAADGADLLVLGTRPHGRFERALGTVAIQCAQHARCPFVAVPESAPPIGDTVAVAFDGSDSSHPALTWTADVAARLGLRVRVLTVWEGNGGSGGLFADTGVEPDDRALEAIRTAAERVAPHLADRAEYVPIEASGKVAARLLDELGGAGVLVMGSRGRGGFTGLLLGSVSQRCLEASPVPVAIIRD